MLIPYMFNFLHHTIPLLHNLMYEGKTQSWSTQPLSHNFGYYYYSMGDAKAAF